MNILPVDIFVLVRTWVPSMHANVGIFHRNIYIYIYIYHYYVHAHNYKEGCLLREETTEGFLCNLYVNVRAIWHRQRTNPGIFVLYRGVKGHWHLANMSWTAS